MFVKIFGMKINIHYIYSITITVLITFVIIGFHNNNVLESKINTVYKNSTDFNSKKSFKEDYYITQQSHDTNLILVVFTVLIGFSSFFTYVNVIKSNRAEITKINKKYKKQSSNWEAHKIDLLELKLKINKENSTKCRADASYFFREGLYYDYLDSMIISIKYNLEYYLWFKKQYPTDSEILIHKLVLKL